MNKGWCVVGYRVEDETEVEVERTRMWKSLPKAKAILADLTAQRPEVQWSLTRTKHGEDTVRKT